MRGAHRSTEIEMATLTDYFDTQAREVLNRLDRGLQQMPLPDTGELHRALRELRGTAQMAREERVYRTVSAFEAVARALASNALTWSDEVADHARETIADLRILIERGGDDDELDARADAAIDRWSGSGVGAVGGDAPAAAPEAGSASREFRDFAAREIAGISDALDTGVQQMAASPMDREPLRMILRRQRALLGAARLDEVPVVAEILRAIEDLTRVIAKLDVGVKQEWLDIYRVAREGLKATIEPLQRDEDPQSSHALSRLRHMREELLERYGAGEAVSAAHESEGLVQAQAAAEPPAPKQFEEPAPPAAEAQTANEAAPVAEANAAAGAAPATEGDVVPIEELCYRGDAALERALELQDAIARVAEHDPQAREAADELFDLIRIARD
ncbi:hypothetical protein BH23GEM10_BH23GEM10_15000 [soil metagenome]